MAKKQPQRVRSRFNSVTGQIEHTTLDTVQLALEYVHAAIDRKAVGMTPPDYSRFVERLAELVAGMQRKAQ